MIFIIKTTLGQIFEIDANDIKLMSRASKGINLKSLGITDNDLLATYKSCVKSFFIKLIFICVVCYVPLVFIAIFKNYISNLKTIQETLNICIPVFIGYQSLSLTRIILNLIKYSRLMRYIKTEKRLTEIINKVISNKTKQN